MCHIIPSPQWGMSCLRFLSCQFPVLFWKVNFLSFQVACPSLCVICLASSLIPDCFHLWSPSPCVYSLCLPVLSLEYFVRFVTYSKPFPQSRPLPCPEINLSIARFILCILYSSEEEWFWVVLFWLVFWFIRRLKFYSLLLFLLLERFLLSTFFRLEQSR